MRKLMLFTIGFGAACAVCAYGWFCDGLIVPACMFACLFICCLLAGSRERKLRIPAVICLGICAGLLWFQGYSSLYLSRAADVDGITANITAYCTDYGYQTESGTAAEGFLYLEGRPYQAKLYVRGDVAIEPGDMLFGEFDLRVTTADSSRGATYHPGKGIFILAYQDSDAQLGKPGATPLWAYPAIIRGNLLDILDRFFRGDAASFAKALLLGDRSEISYERNTSFRLSGIMHIIAVSGLHVTILFTLINLLCLKRRWLVALLGIPTLVLFAAVVGFTPSVTRACIMQCLVIGAMLFGRDYDGPTELSFAAMVMLLVNPMTVTNVSFQLSVGCMIGIILFQKRIYDWLCVKLGCGKGKKLVRFKRWFAGSVSVTLSAISLTTPLSAYYFGTVSLIGVVTNLLTLWAVTIIFYGIILVCVLSVLIPAAAGVLAGWVTVLIRCVFSVSDLLGSLPMAAVYTRSIYIVCWLLFCYVLLGIFLWSKKKQPGVLAGCMILGLLLSVSLSRLELRTDDYRMTVLDVGQGQCILYQSDTKTYVVDCGGSSDTDAADLAADTLLSQGIRKIDGLILTHYDRDHSGGAAYLLSRVPAEEIWLPDYEDDGGVRDYLTRMYHDRVFFVSENTELSFGDTAISLFVSELEDSGNERSLAVLFRRENCDILITGDRSGFGERLLLKTEQIPELDILVAGHHGSANSTCQELLDATRPGIVAISVGENSYGHPAEELLRRLVNAGCVVFRTDLHGNLVFRR